MELRQQSKEEDSGPFNGVCLEKEAVWFKEEKVDPEDEPPGVKDGMAFADKERKMQDTKETSSCSPRGEITPETAMEEVPETSDRQGCRSDL
ncbi:hypothetical protein NDU88_004710 [Pleurodeles waltl]|uniref:Uncharacterized protein n=1 Tax=Pleurodeles waltl TaxID=8319 RepID=A0AAV7W607_PLEWA|nr:hypothetical protein NDU88_004710 [Pleurodeles waltl]